MDGIEVLSENLLRCAFLQDLQIVSISDCRATELSGSAGRVQIFVVEERDELLVFE
jgi:hypothetical protein